MFCSLLPLEKECNEVIGFFIKKSTEFLYFVYLVTERAFLSYVQRMRDFFEKCCEVHLMRPFIMRMRMRDTSTYCITYDI